MYAYMSITLLLLGCIGGLEGVVAQEVPLHFITSTTATQTVSCCGSHHVPDYTYTGDQAFVTTTSVGHVKALPPRDPTANTSSSHNNIWGWDSSADPGRRSLSSSGEVFPSGPTTLASAFARALQCSAVATATTTEIVASDTATDFWVAGCSTTGVITGTNNGICHSSDYLTYSVDGASSLCCPTGWATTPLFPTIFCYTSLDQYLKRAMLGKKRATTSGIPPTYHNGLFIGDRVFTPAGTVRNEIAVATSSSTSSSLASTSVTASRTTSGSGKTTIGGWGKNIVIVATALLYHAWSLA